MARTYSAPTHFSKTLRRWPFVHDDFNYLPLISDVTAILLANFIAHELYYWAASRPYGHADQVFGFAIIFGALLLSCFVSGGLYKSDVTTNPRKAYSAIAVFTPAVLTFLAEALYVLDASLTMPLGQVLLIAVVAPPLIIAQRVIVAQMISFILAQRLLKDCNVVLVLQSDSGLIQQRPDYERLGYHISKSFIVPPRSSSSTLREHWTALAQQIVSYIDGNEIDEVHIAVDWGQWRCVKILVRELQQTSVAIRLLADATALEILRYPHAKLTTDVAFEVQRRPFTRASMARKRLFDVVLSALCLVVSLPVFGAIALAIRFDSQGPIFFRQTRRGFKNSVFRIYKFRTMTVLEDGPMVTQATRDDPRVTRVGRWLRRTSLDELPQLFNVLKGEMSLVGPRPHALVHDLEFKQLVSNYSLRSCVKPGITGWAQIHDMRGETSTADSIRQRVQFDIQYVKNYSLLLDIEILTKTLAHLIRHYKMG